MVAKAFTVSRSGVKREARSPRLTARERLLEHADDMSRGTYSGTIHECAVAQRTFRRLLRAHERDIAERAVAWSREVNRPQHVDIATAIRAAILGPPAAGTRKRRTK